MTPRLPVRILRGASFCLAGVLAGLLAAGCAAPAAPGLGARGLYAFSVISATTPRVMVSGQANSRVRVKIRNVGMEGWEGGTSYSLSYHWVTPFERMVQREGVRTLISRTVNSGQEAEFEAEVGPPPHAGIYRLQWDMVQEGVTWFSRRDPVPMASSLVLVLPDPEPFRPLFASLPGLIAAFGLVLLVRSGRRAPGADGLAPRRTRFARLAERLAPVSDLIWSASSLFVKQLLVMTWIDAQPKLNALVLSALSALVPALFLFATLGGRARPIVVWALTAFASLVLWADVVHFRFFGDVLSSASLSAVGQMGHLGGSIRTLIERQDWWLGVDLVVAIPLLVLLVRRGGMRPARGARLAAVGLLAVVVLVAGWSPVSREFRRQASRAIFRHLNIVQEAGLFAYHADEGLRYTRGRLFGLRLSPDERNEARQWFAERAPQRAGTGPYFGAAKGKNLIFILVESMQGFVVGLSVNGQEITPTLNRLRGESVWTSKLVDQAAEGRTSDAELLNAVSLLPLPRGAAAFQHPGNHFVPLPKLLRDRGYSTLSAVAFEASFWNRSLTHRAYGFSSSLFGPDFGPGEQVGWGLNDRSFLQQMVPRLAALPRPFCAWMITLSLHHPYDSYPDSLKGLDLGRWNGTQIGNYLQAMHLFDHGLADLLEGLRAKGLLDQTVLAIEGDHEAGAQWREVARVAGIRRNTLNWYLADRVPLLIHVPGGNGPRGEIPIVAGQTDVAPTLLALLGVDPARFAFVGRNLLGAPADVPVVRRYGDWLDSRHLFLAGQAYTHRQACFDVAAGKEEPLSACAAGQAMAEREVRVSHRVLTAGLQESLTVK